METARKSAHPRKTRLVIVGLLLVGVFGLGGWAGLHAATDLYFRKAIPAGVPVGPMIWHGARINTFSGCGVVVFWLPPQEGRRIAADGVAALGPATEGRGYPAREADRAYHGDDRTGANHVYHAYGPWMSTPIPPSWTEGTWNALACSKSTRLREFTRAATSDGAFYARSRAGWVLVAPGLDRVLYSYED